VTQISAEVPDWSRELPQRLWDPGRRLLRSVRRYQAARRRGGLLGRIAAKYWALQHLGWSVVTQSEIHLTAEIGGGLLLPHPTGIILHPSARIGPNCAIFHQVTLGVVRDGQGAPVIGGHVDIGAGAKILGPVTIGDHAVIGANAVVTRDIPPGAVAAGVPARILSYKP
jgi:serine O-acetyltransferase